MIGGAALAESSSCEAVPLAGNSPLAGQAALRLEWLLALQPL